jgi:hypothetical protein
MAWAGASSSKPVWCAETGKLAPTSQAVTCTTKEPSTANPQLAYLQTAPGASDNQSGSGTATNPHAINGAGQTSSDVPPMAILPASYHKFTSQQALGTYLADKYRIRTPNELQSCEVCHR